MVTILGLGFTGARLARRLLSRDIEVSAAARGIDRFREFANGGLQLFEWNQAAQLPRNSLMAVLIPPLREPENTALHGLIRSLTPRRIVYVSSTGVYGEQVDVDADTPAMPGDERGRARLEAESRIASGGGTWSSLILRAAAIYGPGRGVHVSLREGRRPRSGGSGVVSRIHVDDLASLVEAGLFSDLEGAWPVADDLPCSSGEIAEWCLGLPEYQGIGQHESATAETAGRRVNGIAIRQRLNVELQYHSWRSGIEASLAEENSARQL
jgi:nucleoside-diphosphate-sugar epimerase